MNTCPITGQPITPPHTISHTAARQLATAALTLPDLMQAVDYALSGLRNGQTGHTAYGPRSPINETLLELIDEMRDSLNTWTAALVQHENPNIRYHNGNWNQAAAILRTLTPRATTWTEAPQMVDECMYAIQRLEHLASIKPAQTTFHGRCLNCQAELVTRQTNPDEITCPECGLPNTAEQARRSMHDQLALTPMPRAMATMAAEIITGHRINPNTVKTWIQRGKLSPNREGRYTPAQIVALHDDADAQPE